MATTVTKALVVLVVDDEEPMRVMERRILEGAGCQVTEAGDGEMALTLLDQGAPFDLIISDIDMPGLSGDDMVRRVRAKHPDLKVLFVTGHAGRLFRGNAMLAEGQAFLEKPFNGPGLLEAMSLLLYGTTSHFKARS